MAAVYAEIAAGVNNSSSTTYTLILPTGVAIGDLIIVSAQEDGGSTLSSGSITDSADGTTFGSNTYTLANQASQNASATRSGIWYCVATVALTGGVSKIRLTTAAANNKTLKVTKLSGATSISFDKTATSFNQATTTAPVTGTTAATTQAKELAVCEFHYANAPTFTAPSGWSQTATTQQTTNGGVVSMSSAYKFLSATGTQSATATLGTTETAGGCIATFAYADAVVPPANTVAPRVAGTTTVGQTLTCTSVRATDWTDDGTGVLTYQWARETAVGSGTYTNIGSATSSTYVLAAADAGLRVRCDVTDTDGNGATTAHSNAVGPTLQVLGPRVLGQYAQ